MKRLTLTIAALAVTCGLPLFAQSTTKPKAETDAPRIEQRDEILKFNLPDATAPDGNGTEFFGADSAANQMRIAELQSKLTQLQKELATTLKNYHEQLANGALSAEDLAKIKSEASKSLEQARNELQNAKGELRNAMRGLRFERRNLKNGMELFFNDSTFSKNFHGSIKIDTGGNGVRFFIQKFNVDGNVEIPEMPEMPQIEGLHIAPMPAMPPMPPGNFKFKFLGDSANGKAMIMIMGDSLMGGDGAASLAIASMTDAVAPNGTRIWVSQNVDSSNGKRMMRNLTIITTCSGIKGAKIANDNVPKPMISTDEIEIDVPHRDSLPFLGTKDAESELTAGYTLGNAVPNPLDQQTRIDFAIGKPGKVTLEVFDQAGKRMKTLIDGDLEAGKHSAELNASDLPPGLYLYRLSSGGFTESKTMTVVR